MEVTPQVQRYNPLPRNPAYDATPPRGNVAWNPGNVQRSNIPQGPYNDPKDSHPGPVGPPAMHVWQETSSSEYWRTHTEHPYSPTPQGAYVEQEVGQTRGQRVADDPKWRPESVIRHLYPPAASQFIGRPFDQRMTARFSGEHGSMAGRRRSYQLIPGERPTRRLTSTYRLLPPTMDERLAVARNQPRLSLEPIVDRSQNGTWRLT